MALSPLDQFYLVGGTALALQLGHRVSVDLDLFTPNPFDLADILAVLNPSFSVTVESESAGLVILTVDGVKVDLVKMSYSILFPPLVVEGVRMLDLRDIAPMKLKAVTQRGSKKDFYDIYYLLARFSLEEMLRLFMEKFQQYEVFHVIKSLAYFEDAETNLEPVVFEKSVTWKKVKTAIQKAVKDLA